ncbi:response regulator transcription factor [Cellvibrio polysaccharolyticus]|uniref:DNA-binding response regulator n=1 Tax=Cellvibrio polysaccharolyticus TaxID=2082724 RepID=A0A928V1M7_9GAMM|nr:response regulator transcription factor [Cellvibrio polysaccharolyticus]MBE8717130.1 DNA-binding response regulator [Cellvibrio polysaccharolyticus]
MKHIFLTDNHLVSPRWAQAFASINTVSELPADWQGAAARPDVYWWCLFDHDAGQSQVERLLRHSAQVIALTRQENIVEARLAISWGARGYLHYLAVPSQLLQVADVVHAGGLWVGPELMRELVRTPAPVVEKVKGTSLATLTPRERSVADAVAAGHTNKEIARALDITERTVKAHLSAVFEKLHIRDRLQLALAINHSSNPV